MGMASHSKEIDFSTDNPVLDRDALLDRVRRHFKRSSKLHIFFTGAKVRIIRNNDYTALDKAYQEIPEKLLGGFDRNELGQPIIERQIISEVEEAIREWYG